jgi:hypothetical protein
LIACRQRLTVGTERILVCHASAPRPRTTLPRRTLGRALATFSLTPH